MATKKETNKPKIITKVENTDLSTAESLVKKKLKELNSKFKVVEGEDSISFGTIKDSNYGAISTGSLLIDMATFYGGIPLAKMSEIFGPESCLKSTLLYCILINAQKQFPNKYVGLADAEYFYDEEIFKLYGGDPERLTLSRTYCAEEQIDTMKELISTGQYSAYGVDSVEAMRTRAELDGETGDSAWGLKAKLMSQQCPQIASLCHYHGTALIWLNQVRASMATYGNSETTGGGKALPFYCSLRMRIGRSKADTKGHIATIRVEKTKNGPSGGHTKSYFEYEKGFNFNRDLVEAGLQSEVIEAVTAQSKKWKASDGTEFNWTSRGGIESVLPLDSSYYTELVKAVKASIYTEIEDKEEE